MRYIENNILCLEYDDFVPKISSRDNYHKLKQRGRITVHGRGGNGSQVLIEFATLPIKYRQKVRKHYGDPYEYAAKQPLLQSIEPDLQAREFYRGYMLPTGENLPDTDTDMRGKPQINYVARYTQNAEWLNMLGRLTADKATLKAELNISITKFWQTATELIKGEGVSLPTNAKRLKGKLSNYNALPVPERYEMLIELHKFGNNNSAKVKDELAEALLLELIGQGHDDTIVASGYNAWAEENNRKPIVPATVGYHRKKHKNELLLEREGVGVVASTLSRSIQRERPTAPLLLINSDDNVLDCYFNNEGNQWYRPTLYVVIDAFNDYILGYAWGDSVTNDLIKQAYKNAHEHVRMLTGDSYMWQQIQTDRWGISGKNTTDLEKWYSSMATFTPAGLKNAASKYIERSFGTTWHQHLRVLFPQSYSGHNIGSKKKLNRDKLKPSNFPSISEAPRMIEAFINTLRHSSRKNGKQTRQQEWLEAFYANQKARAKRIDTAERLKLFGQQHHQFNRITKEGVRPTLEGQALRYELSQGDLMRHIGKKVQVMYDPEDLTQVLITDGKGLRLLLNETATVPSNFADYQPGDAERIKALQAEKKTLLPSIQAKIDERKELLQRAKIDAESRLKAGLLLKAQNHEDQRLYAAAMVGNTGGNLHENTHEEGGVCADNNTKTEGCDTPKNGKKQPINKNKADYSIYEDM